jgi:hypothetical protein
MEPEGSLPYSQVPLPTDANYNDYVQIQTYLGGVSVAIRTHYLRSCLP